MNSEDTRVKKGAETGYNLRAKKKRMPHLRRIRMSVEPLLLCNRCRMHTHKNMAGIYKIGADMSVTWIKAII